MKKIYENINNEILEIDISDNITTISKYNNKEEFEMSKKSKMSLDIDSIDISKISDTQLAFYLKIIIDEIKALKKVK
jgi:hypothetical protein